jgi:predicted SnoaL-like aldol condensation-catalyzing enzyme
LNTASGCNRQPTQRFAKSQQQLAEGIVSYFTALEAIDPKMYQEDRLLKELEMDPFSATANLDTLYLHKAMRAPDAAQFKEAMKKEVSKHTKKGHWEVIRKSEVPSHSKILPAVWPMKWKTRIESRKVCKHKARLNLGGHKQEYGVHYCKTYSLVVQWTFI